MAINLLQRHVEVGFAAFPCLLWRDGLPKLFCFGDKQIKPLITLLDVIEQLADIASSHRQLDTAPELKLKPALLLQPRDRAVSLQDSHEVVGSNDLETKMLSEFDYTLGGKI